MNATWKDYRIGQLRQHELNHQAEQARFAQQARMTRLPKSQLIIILTRLLAVFYEPR